MIVKVTKIWETHQYVEIPEGTKESEMWQHAVDQCDQLDSDEGLNFKRIDRRVEIIAEDK